MDYVYAGTRAKALERELLNETQRELLIGSKSVDEFFVNLQDTFLSPYLAESNGKRLSRILEETLNDAKKLLISIAPDQRVLEVLWLKYDFYNLKAIIKGLRAGISREEIKDHCFDAGLYDPEVLLTSYETNKLHLLDERLRNAVDEIHEDLSIVSVDLILNTHYLANARDISQTLKDRFLRKYITLLIDIFNIRTTLRSQTLEELNDLPELFVGGGSFEEKQLNTSDQALELLYRHFGGERYWKDAIDQYKENNSFSLIEKAIEDYVARWLTEESREIFSLAPLFAYFTAKKNNAQLIRAVHVSKVVGLSEAEIRKTLRNPYSTI